MDLKQTFNQVIEDYDYARPLYPEQLFVDIIAFSNLKDNAKVLEVGAGTGQATEYYIKHDYDITALELGTDQIKYLNDKYKKYDNVAFECVPFENYISNQAGYDLIYSATAFHWIDAEIGYHKAYDLLKEGGCMAVFWQMSSVTRMYDEMHKGIDKIYQQYAPEIPLGYESEKLKQIHELRLSQIQSGGWFDQPEYKEYSWTDSYDANRYTALLNTYSSVQMLQPEIRNNLLNHVKEFINDNGGYIDMPQQVRLYMVRKCSK